MRGRNAAGPEYVNKLNGSAIAKERARAVFETMNGSLRVQDACAQLSICEQRFHQVREEVLQGAVDAAELGLPGRPVRQPSPAEEQVRALEAEVARLKLELQAARVRTEVALALPHIIHSANGQLVDLEAATGAGLDEASPLKKKTTRPAAQVAYRHPSRRTVGRSIVSARQ